MLHKIYTAYIKPKQTDEDLKNRELVLNVLLAGTILVLVLTLALLVVSYLLGLTYVANRIVGLGAALLFIIAVYQLSRSQHFQLAAYLLLATYMVEAVAVACGWGVTLPSAILLFSLIIVLSGILLGARAIPFTAGGVVLVVMGIKILESAGIITPDTSWTKTPIDIGILIGCCIIFGIIALVTWLFNVRMEHSLHRAQRAELGLQRQKMLLESKVAQRTKQLQAAQLEKVQQLYRFAELGQLSTALLHDLTNHLASLTLDIEGLGAENRSLVLRRAKRSIRYIDDMVLRVRDQLHGKTHIRTFDAASEINEVVSLLSHKASVVHVNVIVDLASPKRRVSVKGEVIRFRQLMANLISNAIDAYDPAEETSDRRRVAVTIGATKKHADITVADWGRGISKADRDKLFEPFFSTKKTGMGMGLFIAKQIAEEQFGGHMRLDSKTDHTAFVVSLPAAR